MYAKAAVPSTSGLSEKRSQKISKACFSSGCHDHQQLALRGLAAGDVEETREHLTYDYTDLIGDIGGYLGLFLGWSLLGLTVQLFTLALDLCVCVLNRARSAAPFTLALSLWTC